MSTTFAPQAPIVAQPQRPASGRLAVGGFFLVMGGFWLARGDLSGPGRVR